MPVIKSIGYNVTSGKEVPVAIQKFITGAKYSSSFILCDSNTLQHCVPVMVRLVPALAGAQIIELEPGEESKSLEICHQIWQTLIENNADRKCLLVNIGGGVVSDIGGFSASVYKRGIDFINIPTTLLAMADASVGGKNGVNFGAFKNTIGTITQPAAVFIYTRLLDTLPQRHFKNGLSEIYKVALVNNRKFWKELSAGGLTDRDKLVTGAVMLKNKIVIKDPFDKGIRKILNFGHTIGHALEGLASSHGGDLLHGEAILAGMVVESHIAYQKKMITKNDLSGIVKALQNIAELPEINFSESQLGDFMVNDKKTSHHKLLFSLLTSIGSCSTDVKVNLTQVKKALEFYKTLLS